ncbi:MAG TPA: hypothetical protein VJZ27_08085, partial [Aggregatilineales bacterium]|nr:hypothetical protein [Aggregatilineales bacterium]
MRKGKITISTPEPDYSKGFDWQVTVRILGYLAPYRRNINIAMLAVIASVIAGIAGPPLIGWAVDDGIRSNNLKLTFGAAIAYLAIQAVGFYGFRVQIRNMAVAGQSA